MRSRGRKQICLRLLEFTRTITEMDLCDDDLGGAKRIRRCK